ncbi:MAG: seg [Microgenomates group bacterium GW2011_GWC1_49_7]|nr:MAG: seg [Microgenomates group bacterium GW2011_GWC1_49_7]
MYFSAGDGPFYFAETIRNLGWLPVIWRADEGFGANHGFRLWYDYALQLVIKILSSLGMSWWWIDKLLWVGAGAVAVYGSYTLGKYFFKKPYVYFVPVIYAVNSYVLLLFAGGQLGVLWAYAYIPLVLIACIRAIDDHRGFSLSHAVRRGLSLALLAALDLRFAYLLMGALALYHLFYRLKHGIKGFWMSMLDVGVSLLVTVGIHAFWILPGVLAGGGSAGLDNELTNPGMLRFLSFADFSHAISLLHPNWPENLFGKIYFLQPEFLALPFLAFSSLLFIKPKTDNRKQITFFALVALLGAFLAKGVNEPFGGIFQWMFTHVPGFVMFRDPTKFYVFIAISYSVLIPFTLNHLAKRIISKKSFIIYHSPFIIFGVFWLFTIRALFVGDVRGNFRPMQLPEEYVQLKNLFVADPIPSRTLWIPQREKFAYTSDVHPLLYADQLFPGASVSAVIALAETPDFMTMLAAAGVGYIVVPQDTQQRLFLNDYRYDSKERDALIAALKKTPLVQNSAFDRVAVFENHEFTFASELPTSLGRQQRFTNIGLTISILSLATSVGVLAFQRRK